MAGTNPFEDASVPGSAGTNPFDPRGSVLGEAAAFPAVPEAAPPLPAGGAGVQAAETVEVPLEAGPAEHHAACEMERVRYLGFKENLEAFGNKANKAATRAGQTVNLKARRYKGGKELLAEMKQRMGDQLGSGNAVGAGSPGGEQGKKDLSQRFFAAKRRMEQRVLHAQGKAKRLEDPEFDQVWGNVENQNETLDRLVRNLERYERVMGEAMEAAAAIADDICILGSGQAPGSVGSDDGNNGTVSATASLCSGSAAGGGAVGAAGGVKQRAAGLLQSAQSAVTNELARLGVPGASRPDDVKAAFRAKMLRDTLHALKGGTLGGFQVGLEASLTAPCRQRSEDFPSYGQCVQRRNQYAMDVEAYQRKVEGGENKQEQLRAAEARFNTFNVMLKEELGRVDADRFQYTGQMAENLLAAMRSLHGAIVDGLDLAARA